MATYCVNMNAQSNGDHEVHNTSAGCAHLPEPVNRLDLGNHPNCQSAVAAAQQYYPQSNGCAYCVPECNTQ